MKQLIGGIDMNISDNIILEKRSHMWFTCPDGTISVRLPSDLSAYYLNKPLGNIWVQIDGRRKLKDILRPFEGNNEIRSKMIEALSQLYDLRLLAEAEMLWSSE